MIYKFFKETQDEHRIKSKDLAAAVNITNKHLSEFRQGKANITLDLLWQLVEALDELSPGARRDFGLRIAGCWGMPEVQEFVIKPKAEVSYSLDLLPSLEKQIEELPKESKKRLVMTIVESLVYEPASAEFPSAV
jgi:DNA-binding Xre family transcriptional regulator